MASRRRCWDYLAPCLPPLFGFTKTSRGLVPRTGVTWKDMGEPMVCELSDDVIVVMFDSLRLRPFFCPLPARLLCRSCEVLNRLNFIGIGWKKNVLAGNWTYENYGTYGRRRQDMISKFAKVAFRLYLRSAAVVQLKNKIKIPELRHSKGGGGFPN